MPNFWNFRNSKDTPASFNRSGTSSRRPDSPPRSPPPFRPRSPTPSRWFGDDEEQQQSETSNHSFDDTSTRTLPRTPPPHPISLSGSSSSSMEFNANEGNLNSSRGDNSLWNWMQFFSPRRFFGRPRKFRLVETQKQHAGNPSTSGLNRGVGVRQSQRTPRGRSFKSRNRDGQKPLHRALDSSKSDSEYCTKKSKNHLQNWSERSFISSYSDSEYWAKKQSQNNFFEHQSFTNSSDSEVSDGGDADDENDPSNGSDESTDEAPAGSFQCNTCPAQRHKRKPSSANNVSSYTLYLVLLLLRCVFVGGVMYSMIRYR